MEDIFNERVIFLDKTIIFAISSFNKKYYFDELTSKLPESIKKEIKAIGSYIAEKVNGIFNLGFYEDGSLFIQVTPDENYFEYDEIGASLEVEKVKREEKELINSLQIWYKLLIANII